MKLLLKMLYLKIFIHYMEFLICNTIMKLFFLVQTSINVALIVDFYKLIYKILLLLEK